MSKFGSIEALLRILRKRRCEERKWLVQITNSTFSEYTKATDAHLRELGFFSFLRDRTLATSREQYHLYILEFELVNRLNLKAFLACKHKVALLPHCLRFTIDNCKAESDGLDWICRECTKSCFVNRVSQILRGKGIKPYIWWEANLKDFFQNLRKRGESVGILGIACIAELVRGMRRCQKAGLPVVGVPLNANRCARWWGEWHPTSVDLMKLEHLIS
jgi:hypothetical protein